MLTASNVTEYELVTEITEEFRNTVLPVTVLFGVEMLAGIPGNLLTLYVFLRHYKPCNFRYFVLSLALTDLVSCLTTIPGEMVSQIFWYSYPAPVVCKIKVFFNQYTVPSEAATITIIAIDRYRKVCRPFGWQIRRKAAVCACVTIHAMSALLGIPTAIFWGVRSREIEYKGQNITVTLCEKDEKYHNTSFPLINIIFNGSIMSMSLLLMSVLYVLMAWKLVFSRKISKTVNDKDTEDRSKNASSSTDLSNTSNRMSCKLTLSSGALNRIKDNTPQPREESETSTNGQNAHSKNEAPTTRDRAKKSIMSRSRRKTLISFYLTVIFVITTVLYMTLISVVATGILARLDGPTKAVYFFFLRLYFINHVINPVLYGLLDPHFRNAMRIFKLKANCC